MAADYSAPAPDVGFHDPIAAAGPRAHDPDMTIAREEIFGPVLSIIPYDDEDK